MTVPAAERSEERTEAVIINGPRRGEIVLLPGEAFEFSPEEEALIDQMIASAERIAAMARNIAVETRRSRRSCGRPARTGSESPRGQFTMTVSGSRPRRGPAPRLA